MLLSSGASEALDAVIHLKERKMELKKLGVAIPLHITRTRHFAVEVAYDSESVAVESLEATCKSNSGDLYMYYMEEASFPLLYGEIAYEVEVSRGKDFTLQKDRGITRGDRRGQLYQIGGSDRGLAEGDYTLAEEFVTGFQRSMGPSANIRRPTEHL